MKNSEFYTLVKILACSAHYNLIYGERSNGKSYSVLEYTLSEYFRTGKKLAIIRRWDTDFVGENSAKTCYDSLINNAYGKNVIAELSNDRYNGIIYYAGRYYLTTLDEDGKTVRTSDFVAYAFSLNMWEHYKSASFPLIDFVLFDEFITRSRYLVDEFIIFENLLSTIIRRRDNVKIFMCGNSVDKYACPYFTEMGLYKIKEMKQGKIDVYTYGDSGLRVAVEFSDSPAKSKPSDVYFAFNNPKLNMITGKGNVWEMNIYPHLPVKHSENEVVARFYIKYQDNILESECVNKSGIGTYIYIHRRTKPIDNVKELVYCDYVDARPNYCNNMRIVKYPIQRKIKELFELGKVFYQDNEVGEILRAYMQYCRKNLL